MTKPQKIEGGKKMVCPYCEKEAAWGENKAIYGKNYGKSFMCWYCLPCNAYVGCHNNTQSPLGTMANKELREWRIKAHASIDPWWNGKYATMERKEVYAMLDRKFGKPVHVGQSDVEMCRKIINYMNTK
jgi:hypothetical protein